MSSRAHVFIVTGANRGLGRSIVKIIAQRAEANNEARHIILVGRDHQGLDKVASTEAQGSCTYLVPDIELGRPASEITGPILAKLDEVLNLSSVASASSVRLTLMNSAGTICDLSKTVDQYTENEVTEYTAVNYVSFAALTCRFLARAKTVPQADRIAVANISSLLAVMPFANWGLYASIKAARDQLLKVVALEHRDDPRVRTLSYAPGPLDNDMQAEVRASIGDAEQKKAYSDMHSQKKLVKTDDTAGLLCNLLDEWTFESGAHIDVYDIIGLPE
ncbi:hypothetical protein GGI21_000601 [Coemansia aciculifera]|uniref:Uncharacterized protein n=1 Tax=Coemansia aciculifera TaxID=417176 RepID=A0ACC1M9B7_9FUNG|nr:hypothetical protein IWW38_001006 [Coemansia aciculifera]KAJ2910710.1 hypothetical protein GGI21_000601 [Coemansia aciculifera]